MDKTCTDCGESITTGPTCKSCAAKRRWARHVERNPLPHCKTCGTVISHGNRRKAKYCSHACRVQDRTSYTGRSTNQIQKMCAGCGSEFSVAVSVAGRFTYCSRSCSNAARGRTATCKACGMQFRHAQKQTRHFCCETCRRPPITLSCVHCGDAFRAVPSAAGKGRRYCSRRCYLASNAETAIERIVREALEAAGIAHTMQAPVGPWVVDFLVGDIVVEADGTYWHSKRPDADARKTADLEARGFAVLRYPEPDIHSDGFPERLLGDLAAGGRLLVDGDTGATAPVAALAT